MSDKPKDPKQVSDVEFRRDPATVLRSARRTPVVVTGPQGETRMTIATASLTADDLTSWR